MQSRLRVSRSLRAISIAPLVFAVVFLASCSGEKNRHDRYSANFSGGNTVDYTATEATLHIISDGRWNISVRYENEQAAGQWCTPARVAGNGMAKVVVSFKWNMGDERAAVFSVDFGDKIIDVRLTQEAFRPIPADVCYWNELPDFNRDGEENIMVVTHFVPDKGDMRSFTICYDTKNHYPLWVAYPMHVEYYPSSGQRTNAWQYDPKIPKGFQPDLSNTILNYTRGHMLASAARYINRKANEQTFYFTNMTCQRTGFNGTNTVWTNLESHERSWGGTGNDTLYAVSGAVLRTVGGSERISYTHARNDDKSIAVPNYFYKALVKKFASGHYRGIAFWFRHEDAYRNVAASDAISIRELEQRTGIDFFANLPAAIQDQIETERKPSDWGL